MMKDNQMKVETQPCKAQITFGKFQNVDMRVARVLAAPMAEGTKAPCRVMKLDLGHLGERMSVGQYALLPESDLIGQNVVVCVNLSPREMGPYISEVLVLGAPHPNSPEDQAQATPLFVNNGARVGDCIF
jgi:tRNA-binding protein